ncbi:hypothetical protein Tco_1340345, partial [Tanacetum coccineum]
MCGAYHANEETTSDYK